jgi:hypothetical protein
VIITWPYHGVDFTKLPIGQWTPIAVAVSTRSKSLQDFGVCAQAWKVCSGLCIVADDVLALKNCRFWAVLDRELVLSAGTTNIDDAYKVCLRFAGDFCLPGPLSIPKSAEEEP